MVGTHFSVQSYVQLGPNLLDALSALSLFPALRYPGIRWLCIKIERDRIHVLQQANQEERHFVVSKLCVPTIRFSST